MNIKTLTITVEKPKKFEIDNPIIPDKIEREMSWVVVLILFVLDDFFGVIKIDLATKIPNMINIER